MMKSSTIWPEIELERSARAPTLRRQIERQLACAIRDGRLPSGCRLPSSRSMAKLLSVSRGTVVDAYETLLATGELIAIANSGIRVSGSSQTVAHLSKLERAAIAAHYPIRQMHFADWDGTSLYFTMSAE